MDVIIQCGVRQDMPTWTLSSIVVTMYIHDFPLLSTITWNVTHMDFTMKIILKAGFHHIVEIIWGLNVVSSTSLDAIILNSENVIVK